MFTFDASVSNKVISINDYIDCKYVTIDEITNSLNDLTVMPITIPMVWTLLSMRGLVIEHLQYGHEITRDAKYFTTRTYVGDRLEILWKKDLIPLLSQDIERLFKA